MKVIKFLLDENYLIKYVVHAGKVDEY
jgi:hypothetical protein